MTCQSSPEEYSWTLNPYVLKRLMEGQSVLKEEVELLAGVGGD
jgi:hypothetical protein